LVGRERDEVGELVIRTLDEQKKSFGGEHSRTLENLSYLGLLYSLLEGSDIDKAVKMLRRALEGLMKMMSKDHSTVICCAHHILSALNNCGRVDDAVKILEEYDLHSVIWEALSGDDSDDDSDI
jgi:hypothetical protein